MSDGNLHITRISRDPASPERYGSSNDRAYRKKNASPKPDEAPKDRLEISDEGRRLYRERVGMDRARQALDELQGISARRRKELEVRMRSGYYSTPLVTRRVATRLASS